jgi:hypothetical protein
VTLLAPAPTGSTYERLRLAALDVLAADQVDGRDPNAVEAVVDARVAAYQDEAVRGLAAPLTNPTEVKQRLLRSLTGAGPLQKFFDQPDTADEVMVKGGTVTYWTRDGRQRVDHEPTCEAELTTIAQLPPSPHRPCRSR